MSEVAIQNSENAANGYDRQEPKTPYLIVVPALIVFVLSALVLLVVLLYRQVEQRQITLKVEIPVDRDAIELREREEKILGRYEYINKEEGLVRLPIGRAMELLAAEDAAGKYPFPTTPYPIKPLEATPPASGGESTR